MPADRSADNFRAALEAEGWQTALGVILHEHGRTWVARAAHGGRTVEGRAASAAEAWRLAHQHALREAAAGHPTFGPDG